MELATVRLPGVLVLGVKDRFRDRGPTLEEVEAAFQRLADSARAKLAGKPVDADQNQRDRHIIDLWERILSGVDLETEAERARQKLSEAATTPRRSGR